MQTHLQWQKSKLLQDGGRDYQAAQAILGEISLIVVTGK